MTSYPELTNEYQKIVDQGENCLITLLSHNVSLYFGTNPIGFGHILNLRMTNGIRFDAGAPYDIYAKVLDAEIGTLSLTKWE